MAELSGTNLAGSIVPFTTDDTFATHLAKFGKGGWRSVADTAERDGITADRREAGMAVYVVAEKKLYILADDLTSWTELDTDSGYTKDEIDGLLAAIEAQIDANADAIQKTREDYAQADADIMTIINAHADQITTNKNDIDDLGDQVAEIETKIPESASTENPLVTRSEISSVYKFKGSVATYNDLPAGATVGDVYNVTDTGANYAWDGSAWDKLSETVDLSSYATTAYVNAREQDIRSDYMVADSELQTQINGLSSAVETNQSNITILRTDVDGLENQVDANHNDITAHIADTSNPHNVTKTQVGLGNVDNTSDANKPVSTAQQAAINTAKQDVISGYTTADGELQQQINAHATAITNLEDGVDSINGKIPTNASTTNLLVSTSQLNTEIQDVRADFMADDAALQTQISGQATTIAGIQDDITGINSKISASASSTNKLVSASELSATEQDIRADMNEADSQLQTQITAQAGSITTLRNDTDDLGDQVAGIEGKIPAAASSSNQLALNSQITSLQTQITTNTNNFTNYRTSAAQDVIDSNLQSQITNGLALKLDKDQGSANQGKILSVGSDGQITLTAAPGGGLQAVTHNSTLTGAGTDASPLGIASSVLSELADKANQTVVDALASTVSSIQTDYTPKATTTALSNTVSGIQSDYVSKTATTAQTIASSLQTPELTVGTAEGTLNLSITAGVATIATNNGLDIISQTKFDTLPTTDDTTTWANALDANLVSKAQVASALSELPTGANLPILMYVWADHLLNDISWLRADTFSWQSGDVYVAAYNHLVTDFENAEVNHWYAWAEIGGGIWYTKTPTVAVGDTVYNDDFSVFGQVDTVYSGTNFTIGANDFNRSASNDITVGDTETIAGIEITFYRAEDGHKICLPDQEDKILALYNSTGVAWYYILDTANKQFKLPRTKFGFTGLRDEVGGYVEPGLPDHTHDISFYSNFGWNGGARIGSSDRANDQYLWEFTSTPASESNEIYKDGETVQPPATQMYLYFYVGNFEKDAIEQTAGINAEMFNGKADVDLGNIPATYDYVVESQLPTADNGYTWYRKYKSGWVEQGGIVFPATSTATRVSITLPITMGGNVYSVQVTGGDNTADTAIYCYYTNRTTTGFQILYNHTTSSYTIGDSWQVSGMAA